MKNRVLPVAVLATTMAALTTAQGRTLYVAPDGDDRHQGTPESPLRTIQKAAAIARAGDTVLVRAGLYKGQVFLRFSGEPGKPIIFKNAPGERPVVDGEGRGRIELQSERGWQKPIGWITVEGFEVRNGWDGIKFYNAHDIVLKGNHIHDNANQGILGNGHHVRIEGNVIVRNGLKPDNERSNKEHGIYCTGTDFTIVNNVIHSNRAYGIQVAGYPYKPENHAGPEFAGARRWLIAHNTIAFQENRAGIVVWQRDASDCVIEGNIFYRNAVKLGTGDCQGVDFVAPGGGHVIRHNLFFAPGRIPIGESSGDYTASENLEKDPLFVDAERLDFRLRKGSPAIDAGEPVKAVASDLEGTPRPQGGRYDIGAYETSAYTQAPAPLFLPAPGSPLVLEGAPVAARAGDFNSDGTMDLLVILSNPVGLQVLPGDGAGRFKPAQTQRLDLPSAPGEIVLAEFNADGNLDLAAVTHDSYDVLVLLGDGQGRLSPAPGSPLPSKRGTHPHAHGLVAGDVNHDRHLDLLVIHSDPDNALAVLLNDGKGRFAPAPGSPFPLGRTPYPSALADVNADGHSDVISPSTQSNPPSLTVLQGDGRGAFHTAPVQPELKVKRPFYVAAGDIDGDKDPDLLVTHDDTEKMSLLLNNGKGAFTESSSSPFPLGGPAWHAVITDFNADGRPDFATAGAGHVRAFLAGEKERFSPAAGSPYPVPRGSWRLALADLNADGKADLITCGVEDRRITLLLQR